MATQIDVGRPLDVGRVGLALRPWRRWPLLASVGQGVDTQLLLWALVPALTFVAVAWVTVIWLALDRAPLFYDPVDHVSLAIDFVNNPVEYLSRQHMWYPPFVHVLLGGALVATGYDLDSAIAVVNLAFFAVLLAATFAIGAELWSPRVGAVAALLVAFYPATFVHLRFPMLDLPLTAMVAASMFALIRSRSFQDRRWCVVLGVFVGLGCLTKQSYVFAMALPVLYAVLTAPRRKQTLLNVALAGLVAAIIALPWYAPRLGWFLGPWAEQQSAFAKEKGDAGTFTASGLVYYLLGTWHQASFAFALLWVLALPSFLHSDRKALVVLWWAGTVALTSLLALKDSRFLMPALPAIALMTAAGLCRLPRSSAAVAAVVAFGGVQLWAVSFGAGWLPEGTMVSNGVYPSERLQMFTQNYLLVGAERSQPDPTGWGTVDGLAGLRGYVGVVGEKMIYDVARLPTLLEAQRRGYYSTGVAWTSCEDPSSLQVFDAVVVQVGGPGSPKDSAEYARCTAGLREVGRIPVTTRHLLKGVSYLAVFRPVDAPTAASPP